jgi:hypothetical protein
MDAAIRFLGLPILLIVGGLVASWLESDTFCLGFALAFVLWAMSLDSGGGGDPRGPGPT